MPSDEGANDRGPGEGVADAAGREAGMTAGDRTDDRGIELKGGMYTFMSLKLLTADLDVIDERLADKVQQAPGFFKDTPVVVDLTALESLVDEDGLPLPPTLDGDGLLACIRKHRLVPMVLSVADKSSPLSARIALPSIEGGARRASVAEHGKPDGKPEISRATVTSLFPDSPREGLSGGEPPGGEIEYVARPPLLIDRPIRSGQQIYARDTDLIVVGQVSPGAEVIADNNVHVYGPLRGRALCGVSGNKATRIFCQSLEAELVSVAGNYRMLETIPEELRGKPAKISLGRNDRLEIEPL